jgi:GAF domain-containing protein
VSGGWQILAVNGVLIVASLCLIGARTAARREKLDLAEFLLVAAIIVAYGFGPLFWSGITWINIVGGTVLIFVISAGVRARHWQTWLVLVFGLVGLVLLFDLFEPLPRYYLAVSPWPRLYVVAITGALVLAGLWQIARLFRSGSIHTRLLIAFGTVAFVPVLVLIVGMVLVGLRSTQAAAVNQLEAVADLKESEIDTWLTDLQVDLQMALLGSDVRTHVQTLAQAGRGPEEGDKSYQLLTDRLNAVRLQSGRYEELFLIDTEGTIIASSDAAHEGQVRRNQAYFKEGLEAAFLQAPYYSTTDARTYLYASHPILNEEGQPLGVLAGSASLDILNKVVSQGGGLGRTEETYLVGHNQTLLTPTRGGKVNVWVTSEGIQAAVAGQTSSAGLFQNYERIAVVGAYRWSPELEAALVVEQQQIEAFGPILATLLTAVGAGLLGLLVAVLAALYVTRTIGRPLADLAETAIQIASGDLGRVAQVEREDEIGTVAAAFNAMTTQLRGLIGKLEKRVAQRTQQLERRSRYLSASAQVGRTAATFLDAGTLIQQVVDLIQEQFDLYYVGLFLADGSREWAVLRAGTGEAGRKMLARDHRHRIGEGMVGWSIAHAEPRIALEAGEDAVRLATPELPDTRSEAALPLRSRGQVLGALTVQHTEAGAFDSETIIVLQTMADQVAVALHNAYLFEDRQQVLTAIQRAYGQISREAWQEILRSQANMGFRSDGQGLAPVRDVWLPEMEQAVQTGQTVRHNGSNGDRQPLAIPITVRGQVIGVLDTYKPQATGQWAEEEVLLLEAIADQMGEALESARLYQETQRRASHEEAIRQITERMRSNVDVESLLQNTVAELAKALGAPRAYVRLGTETDLEPHRNDVHVMSPAVKDGQAQNFR